MSVRTDKVRNELVKKYKLLRAVHVCYYGLLNTPVSTFAEEFFVVSGYILDGRSIPYGELTYLKEDRVLEYLKEDR